MTDLERFKSLLSSVGAWFEVYQITSEERGTRIILINHGIHSYRFDFWPDGQFKEHGGAFNP